ncbi:hypothetical protein V2J09_020082 [Rumex salicifolius]
MNSLPNLSLSPPTPSPATPTAASSLQNPTRKKRTKAFCLQSPPDKPKTWARKPDLSAPKITVPCSECGKKFWSLKALYGHMRCHPDRQWRGINPPNHFRHQPENSSTSAADDYEAATCLLLLAMGGAGGYCGDATAAVGSGHTCGVCFKVFSSGQALGGHMRCHWEKNNSGGGSEPPASSLGGGGGLDLNLPASQLEEMQLVWSEL